MMRVANLPVRLQHNLVLVAATINGKPVSLAIDTGSATTMLFSDAAADLGLSVAHDDHHHVFGIGGEVVMGDTEVGEFSLDHWSVKNWRVPVGGHGSLWKKLSVAGVLGENFLQSFDVEFDLANGRMALFDPRHCDSAWLGFWSDKAIAVDFERGDPPQTSIVLTVAVNGKPLRAQLDSGANSTLLASTAAERVGRAKDDPGVEAAAPLHGFGEKEVESWVGPFDSFRLGDETIRNVRLRFGDFQRDNEVRATGSRIAQAVIAWDLLLGEDFIGAHHLLISHSQRKLYFSYNGGQIFRGG